MYKCIGYRLRSALSSPGSNCMVPSLAGQDLTNATAPMVPGMCYPSGAWASVNGPSSADHSTGLAKPPGMRPR